MTDVFKGMGVRLESLGQEDFLKVRETLTRIGSVMPPSTLYQTCYVLHKKGQYAIMHHNEMKAMDGEDVSITDEDDRHRNTVACLLDQWGLATIIEDDAELARQYRSQPGTVTVIPHREKSRYKLEPLYEIGKPARIYA